MSNCVFILTLCDITM